MACLQYIKCILSVCIWCFALCLSLLYFLELETYFEGFGIKYKTYLFGGVFIRGLRSSALVVSHLTSCGLCVARIGAKTPAFKTQLNIFLFRIKNRISYWCQHHIYCVGLTNVFFFFLKFSISKIRNFSVFQYCDVIASLRRSTEVCSLLLGLLGNSRTGPGLETVVCLHESSKFSVLALLVEHHCFGWRWSSIITLTKPKCLFMIV